MSSYRVISRWTSASLGREGACTSIPIPPQGAADQGIDAVRADQHVGFDDLAVAQVQSHAGLVLLEPVDGTVDLQDAWRQGGQQPLIQVRAQQADEPAGIAPA